MADMIYRLVLRAQFENQAELTKAVEGLNQIQISGAKATVTVGGLGRTGTEGMTGLATSVLRLGFMFNMMESALMRQEMAVMMAENAQNRLSDAIARYGANSEQARRATKQMESEMSYLNNANIRANVSMGLMATQLILQSGLLKQATIAQITKTLATAAATLGEWAHVAALQARALWQAIVTGGMAVPLMLAGAVVGGAALGAYAGSREEGGAIQKTGTYTLHEGEWVLPKNIVDKFTSKETFKSLEKGGLIEKEKLNTLNNSTSKESRITTQKNSTLNNQSSSSKSVLNSFTSKDSFKSMKEGGLIEKEGLYYLHSGERVMSKQSSFIERSSLREILKREAGAIPSSGGATLSAFSFETHLHVEMDLDAALAEQNRRIKNEYRRAAS